MQPPKMSLRDSVACDHIYWTWDLSGWPLCMLCTPKHPKYGWITNWVSTKTGESYTREAVWSHFFLAPHIADTCQVIQTAGVGKNVPTGQPCGQERSKFVLWSRTSSDRMYTHTSYRGLWTAFLQGTHCTSIKSIVSLVSLCSPCAGHCWTPGKLCACRCCPVVETGRIYIFLVRRVALCAHFTYAQSDLDDLEDLAVSAMRGAKKKGGHTPSPV